MGTRLRWKAASALAAVLVVAAAAALLRGPVLPPASAANEWAEPYNQGLALVTQRSYAAALPYAAEAARLGPAEYNPQYLLGFCYARLNRPREAFSALSRAYQLAPDSLGVVDEVARCYVQAKDYDHAIAVCRAYLSRHADSLELESVKISYAQALAARGRCRESYDLFRSCLSWNAADEGVWTDMLNTLDCPAGRALFDLALPEYLRRFPSGRNREYFENRQKQAVYTSKRQEFEKKAAVNAKKLDGDAASRWVGVPDRFAGQIKPEFLALVKQGLRSVPEWIWLPLIERGCRVEVVTRVVDGLPERFDVKSQPRGYAAGATYENVPALYQPESNVMLVGQRYKDESGQDVAHASPDEAMCHELGHAYDSYLGRLSEELHMSERYDNFSASGTFRQAYEVDVKRIAPAQRAYLSYFLQAGDAGRQELFAEMFPLLFEKNPQPGSQLALFATAFPSVLKSMSGARSLDPEYIRYRDLYESRIKNFPSGRRPAAAGGVAKPGPARPAGRSSPSPRPGK